MTRTIAVVGSLNVDFITRTPRMPAAGETLTASSFDIGFGGKGANQAVASARLAGQDVRIQMVGNVGDDSFGKDFTSALKHEGINTSAVRTLKGHRTGIANIIVEETTGENRILLATNANHAFSESQDASWDMVPEAADVVIFQLEIPLPVVLHNIQEARKGNKHVVLNPAPAIELPDDIYAAIDTLVLNESEAGILAGAKNPESLSAEQIGSIAKNFLLKGVRDAVIVTLGGQGLYYRTKSGEEGKMPARKVNVVDTTAAGDTFVGAYAVHRASYTERDFDHKRALDFATYAASRTVEKKGAMAAIPSLQELRE